MAISNQHSVIIQLLISHPDVRLSVRDRQGLTPFACAMTYKNNRAAEAILKREPGAAEQVRDPHPVPCLAPELSRTCYVETKQKPPATRVPHT